MGRYDYCKICVDNAPFWEDKIMSRFGYKERVSTLNALNTLIARRYFNENIFKSVSAGFFIGSEDTHLSLLEKHTLLTLESILSSCVAVSDNISSYDDLELELIKKAFPNPKIKNVIHKENNNIHTFEFTKNGSSYLAVSNFNNSDNEFIMPKGIYCGKLGALLPSGSALSLAARQTQVLVKVDIKKTIQLIYSDAHVLPLFEVEKIISESENSIEIIFKSGIRQRSEIYIIAPKDKLYVNKKQCRLVQNYGKRSIFIYETETGLITADEKKISGRAKRRR
jgi:hypothetical protein